MSHTFRKDCSLYEAQPMSKFDTSPHSSTSSGTSTSSGQSFRFSFSRQQSKMDSNQVSFGSDNHFGGSFGSDGFSGSSSGFGGDFGQRASPHQSSWGSFTPRNHSGNCYSFGSKSFGNSGNKLENGNEGSAGQGSSFSSRLPHLGSGGNLTVVESGEGGHKKGGPPLDWDRLVDGVFTDEIAKLFWNNLQLQLLYKWTIEWRLSDHSVSFLIFASGFSIVGSYWGAKAPNCACPICTEALFSFILFFYFQNISYISYMYRRNLCFC